MKKQGYIRDREYVIWILKEIKKKCTDHNTSNALVGLIFELENDLRWEKENGNQVRKS